MGECQHQNSCNRVLTVLGRSSMKNLQPPYLISSGQAAPTLLRTNKNQKTKAMLGAYGISTLFVALTFSEQWPAYQKIIASTGSRNTLPSDRPWEAVQYYYEHLYWIKSRFLRNPKLSGFGILKELIERQEFQLSTPIISYGLRNQLISY